MNVPAWFVGRDSTASKLVLLDPGTSQSTPDASTHTATDASTVAVSPPYGASLRYTVLLHSTTMKRIQKYQKELINEKTAGTRLEAAMASAGSQLWVTEWRELLRLLLHTKEPHIFAEHEVLGGGADWNQEELTLLGDVAIAVPTLAYDNGLHKGPSVHPEAIPATLLYVPGTLLKANSKSAPPADWVELVQEKELELTAFCALYERRLLPALQHASDTCLKKKTRALVTVPGLGCGCFAGRSLSMCMHATGTCVVKGTPCLYYWFTRSPSMMPYSAGCMTWVHDLNPDPDPEV